MRIYYHLSGYVSHRNAGMAYMECLRFLGHEVLTGTCSGEGIDAAILHDEPLAYPAIFAQNPWLRQKRVIGYCVWEGNLLPAAYVDRLQLVNEVWTCSDFCLEVIRERFPNVKKVPHVVERINPSRGDLAEARQLMGQPGPDDTVFFSIVDSMNPRKNVKALISAFSLARARARRKLRLVLKQYRKAMDFSSVPGVISINGHLPEGVIRALQSLAGAYVSAHHAEGWGLGLSEAMVYGKPVIATGYSGNMEFMDERNSFPLPYKLSRVSAEMCRLSPLFTQKMLWADVDIPSMIRAMLQVARDEYNPLIKSRAARISDEYTTARVAGIIEHLLGLHPR